jgi:hypothetical protein
MCVGVCLNRSFHSLCHYWNVSPCLVKFTKNITLVFQMDPWNQFSSEKSIGTGPEVFNLYEQATVVHHLKWVTCVNWLVRHLDCMLESQLEPIELSDIFHTKMSTLWVGYHEETQGSNCCVLSDFCVAQLLGTGFNTIIWNVFIWSNMHD